MSGLNGLETAILVLGSVFSAASLVFSITGLLELLVILGPISCGCTRISSWWLHNALLLLLWLPTLGISGWLLHEGWPDAVPFVALGAFFVVAHMMLLFCYWLRRTLRKQQAKQLPTQELLTEAQRVMIAGNTETAQIQGRGVLDAQVSGRTDQFQLQVGRTDGAAGFTLYIPGEAEEAVLQDLTAKHYQKRMMTAQAQAPPAPAPAAGGALPPTSSFRSSSLRDSANTGAASPLPASSSMRSLRGANGSPEKNPPGPMNAGADPGHGSRRGGVIQVLLPEALARWNQGRASNRYRVLTDSALPSPAGGPPTATGAAADAVAAVPRSQREFPFTQGDGAQAADGTDDTRDDGEGGMDGESFQRDGELSGSLVEANNPLFGAENSLGNELSLRASDLMPQAAASGSSSEWRTASPPPAAASDAPTMPTSSGANGVPGFRMHARSMASAGVMSGGSMARHSMDPVLLSPHVLMQPTHGHTLSSDRMNSPWLSQLHLSSSTPDGPAALRGGSLINMTPPTANRLDSGRAGLLDAGQDSSAVVDGGATPEPLHGSGGARAGASHTEGRRIGGGLLGGRLWQAHHNRTRSFPTVSTLTAALLQDQDRSAEAGSSGDLGVEASPRAAVRNV